MIKICEAGPSQIGALVILNVAFGLAVVIPLDLQMSLACEWY
jgi:hypothetical protein